MYSAGDDNARMRCLRRNLVDHICRSE